MNNKTSSRSVEPCLPFVDPAVLDSLRIELDDDEGWLLFLRTFLDHLPRRMEKLRSGVVVRDYDLAMDAVLSLRISCEMVGAERLAGMAFDIQRSLCDAAEQGRALAAFPLLHELLVEFTACAEQTAIALGTRVAQES